ncbi:hypothetical protein WN55_03964 [Dufourea novaeangliae]|uniref:Uncharacterized protein n=1 Tax=Dufourea novaeangliae TaxID=178035 RepID=A0A154PL04_DUFNO|nr:hypothetical protein WN55_03964 [Dufourea novaeangliae]
MSALHSPCRMENLRNGDADKSLSTALKVNSAVECHRYTKEATSFEMSSSYPHP